jgi:hypothetical protein
MAGFAAAVEPGVGQDLPEIPCPPRFWTNGDQGAIIPGTGDGYGLESSRFCTMTRNRVLDDPRETRKRLLAEAGGTLDGLVAQLQRDERRSDREFVAPVGRGNRSAAAAKSWGLGPNFDR